MPKIREVMTENNDFQRFEVLKRNRNKRHQYGQFFVEGVRNINEAIHSGWRIDSFLYAKQVALSSWATNILKESRAKQHYELHNKLLEKLSDKEETSEIIAIVEMPKDDLRRIRPIEQEAPLLIAIFDRPSNRGNLGSIIRSCDALGCQGLIMTGHAVDLYDPETIRASTGSFFRLPTIRLSSPKEVAAWVEELSRENPELQIVGTDESAQKEIYYTDFKKPTILLIGNETQGLSHAYQEWSHFMVKIPMGGSASSLNVACATSILLYEISRQRDLGY